MRPRYQCLFYNQSVLMTFLDVGAQINPLQIININVLQSLYFPRFVLLLSLYKYIGLYLYTNRIK